VNSKPVTAEQSEKNSFTVVTTDIGDALLELLSMMKEMDNDVMDIRIERASLEQRFLEIAKEGKCEDKAFSHL
jgi:ABC-2 type transport system ATP-binding protein